MDCEKEPLTMKAALTKSQSKHLDLDEFIEHVGQFGLMQKILVLIFCLLIFAPTYQTMVMVFVGHNPPWMCSTNQFNNGECNFTGVFFPDHALYESRCSMNRSSWMFADNTTTSIVTEYDLVCSRAPLVLVSNSITFLGRAIGTVPMGWISDRFGRKTVLFPSFLLVQLFGLISAFAPNIWFFMGARFIVGVSLGGIQLILIIMAAELVGPKYRAFASTSVFYWVPISLCFCGLQAFYIRDWRMLSAVLSGPYLVFVAFWGFVPESIRWLRVNQRLEDAEHVLRRLAHWNKATFPDAKLLPVRTWNRTGSLKDVFRTRKIAVLTVIQAIIWFTNGMVFYGVSLASDELGGNMYRDFVLTSLVELPASFIAHSLSDRYGRKKTIVLSMTLCSSTLFGVASLPSRTSSPVHMWSRVGLGMASKTCITISFNNLYVLSAEMYPTVVRSQAMAMMSVISMIGATAAPFITQGLRIIHDSVPFYTMGAICMLSSLLCLILKDTRGKPMVETLTAATRKDLIPDGTEKTVFESETLYIDDENFPFKTSSI